MTEEEVTGRPGDIRAEVLSRAVAALEENDAVPHELLARLQSELNSESPPKPAALLALIEQHFKEAAP